jgi:2-oxoglutarate ferredoxin oxidoreductase subunit beta
MPERRLSKLLVEESKYCAGCGHGIVNRCLAECLDELGVSEDAIGVCAVGCSCWMIDTFGIDWIQAPHGRAPATATGIKRTRPDKTVVVYQGDGDCLAIGMAETIHSALRGENFSVVFINNGNFGMTGGQMAPTTIAGQKTPTSIYGRDVKSTGQPVDIIKLLSAIPTTTYLARGTVTDVPHINKVKSYIKKALRCQVEGRGYAFVEVVSPCPTNWGLDPLAAVKRIKEEVLPVYVPGEYKDESGLDKEASK